MKLQSKLINEHEEEKKEQSIESEHKDFIKVNEKQLNYY